MLFSGANIPPSLLIKVVMTNSLTCLNQMPTFEWSVVECASTYGRPKNHMFYKRLNYMLKICSSS